MEVVIADEDLAGKLPHLKDGAAIKNREGHIIGIFKPIGAAANGSTGGECPYTEAEMAAIEAQPGGYTLEQIWRRLGRRK